jgi:hypothetical protein
MEMRMIKKIIQLRCDEKTAETLDNDLNDVFEIKTTQDLFTEYGDDEVCR